MLSVKDKVLMCFAFLTGVIGSLTSLVATGSFIHFAVNLFTVFMFSMFLCRWKITDFLFWFLFFFPYSLFTIFTL